MEDEVREPSLRDRLLAAPGWVLNVVFGLGTLSMAWAASSPTGLDLTGDPFAWLGLACALSFLLRFAVAASHRAVTTAFLGAPLMAGVLAAGVYLELPQQSRWMQAEGGFESALRALPSAKDWDQGAADGILPGRIGTYSLTGVTRDAAGAAQFHLDGTLLGADGAAFTYLVDGPTAEVHDANPGASFEHLSGKWYVVS